MGTIKIYTTGCLAHNKKSWYYCVKDFQQLFVKILTKNFKYERFFFKKNRTLLITVIMIKLIINALNNWL